MSKKILIIIPPSTLFPIGWAYVAAVFKSMQLDYDVFGFYHDNNQWNNRAWFKRNIQANNYIDPPIEIDANISEEELACKLIQNKYDYIMVGGLVGYFKWWYRFLPFIKSISPESKIIIGGGITKNLPAKMLFDKLQVDYILKGEAEVNLEPFIESMMADKASDEEFGGISGLCWIDETGQIKQNPVRRFDISSSFAMPAWESLNGEEFIRLSGGFPIPGKTNFTMLIGRGCPNVCSFCSPTVGRHVPGNLDFVFEEMKHWLSLYRFDYFSIASEVAFVNDEQTNEFCDRYKKEINIPWIGQMRTDIVLSDDTYTNLAESGCKMISFGFESANDRILKIMRKETTFKDHLRNIRQAKKAGLAVVGSFIYGHESETADEMKETFKFVKDYDLLLTPFIGMNSLVIYPGTEYYRNAVKKGMVDDTFKFLLTYSNKSGICTVDMRNQMINAHVNVSAVADDDYYNLLAEETIKVHHSFQKRHYVKDCSAKYQIGTESGLEFSGVCSHCGNPVNIKADDYTNPFNIGITCSKCFYRVYVLLSQLANLKGYLTGVKDFVKDKERVLVVGEHFIDIIYNSCIGLEYSKMVAWYNPNNPSASEKEYYYSKQQVQKEDLKNADIDAIITTGGFDNLSETLEIDRDIPVYNILPNIVEDNLYKMLSGKKIAVIGGLQDKETLDNLKSAECCMTYFSSVDDLNISNERYDYLLCDDSEDGVSRVEIAANSQYQVKEILSFNSFKC